MLDPHPAKCFPPFPPSAIVVPAFCPADIMLAPTCSAHVAASAHLYVTVTPALGPCREIAQIVTQQLVESGWRPGDSASPQRPARGWAGTPTCTPSGR